MKNMTFLLNFYNLKFFKNLGKKHEISWFLQNGKNDVFTTCF